MRNLVNRTSIFVDGNNMFYAQQKNGWFFDPRRILSYFIEPSDVRLINAFWYTCLLYTSDAADE